MLASSPDRACPPTSLCAVIRTEWSAFRSALGRPRRLSPAFLNEERIKLEDYRRIIRDVQRRAVPTPPPGQAHAHHDSSGQTHL